MANVTLQPVQIETLSADTEGLLAFTDGKLVAVLVRLSDEVHGAAGFAGQWWVETGFGPCVVGVAPILLDNVEAVRDWVAKQLSSNQGD
jgi:hypothetical protein